MRAVFLRASTMRIQPQFNLAELKHANPRGMTGPASNLF